MSMGYDQADIIKSAFNSDKFQFRIGEMAAMTGVSTRQLRYWESKGIVSSIERAGEQDARVYTFSIFVRVSSIKALLDEGYTLKAAVAKTNERVAMWSLIHNFVPHLINGIAEIDGKQMLDMGMLDATTHLYAYRNDAGQVLYHQVKEEA